MGHYSLSAGMEDSGQKVFLGISSSLTKISVIVSSRIRFFELKSVLCIVLTPVGSTLGCEFLQGKDHVLFFTSAFSSLAESRPQKMLKEQGYQIVSPKYSYIFLYCLKFHHLRFILCVFSNLGAFQEFIHTYRAMSMVVSGNILEIINTI